MSSSKIMPAMTPKAPKFPLPSTAPMPIRLRKDRAWMKVDRALDYPVFERKRKSCVHDANASGVSASKRQCIEKCIRERVEALMVVGTSLESSAAIIKAEAVDQVKSVGAIVTPTSIIIKSEPVEATKPINAISKPTSVTIKTEAAQTKAVSELVLTKQSTTTLLTQPFTRGPQFIKCRVTGHPRVRQKMDDFESMWDVKDEQRWNAWCKKDTDERGLMEGYEDGDSDYEWAEFKDKRSLRIARAARNKKRV